MTRRVLLISALVLGAAGAAAGARIAFRTDQFSHAQHRALFPSCDGCHASVTVDGATPWPAASACATCHDGTIRRRTDWQPPAELPHTNLRFSHAEHRSDVRGHRPDVADSAARCETCHIEAGQPWMQVRLAAVPSCLTCHGVTASHFEAPDTACATCHVPLARAVRLVDADVARFPEPASHRDSSFRAAGHGALARRTEVSAAAARGASGTSSAVAASCATCHARDFCTSCHVNAPEVRTIQALAPDPRSLAIKTTLKAPPSHARPTFIHTHGSMAGQASCASCHTRESCATCHAESQPKAVAVLQHAGVGRGRGAVMVRRRPASHGADFSEAHAPVARATPRTCANCHARTECLSCHRPDAASASGGYHPAGFLTRHPAAAYARQTSCSGCHNQSTFCSTCHERAGLVSTGVLRAGFHDAKPNFLFGHGQAARQSLETCTSCHVERDCLTCHSATGGRRFNPHGAGFDAARLRRKNPGMCVACHGQSIPGG